MLQEISLKPIGVMKSCFKTKNGTPRQATVSPSSTGQIQISKDIFNNPEHSLEGLREFSHVWIMFYFHLNEGQATKAKVKPPRMNGKKVGVFATRSPHRPSAIGLTLAKIDKIQHDTVFVSGIDIVDGTPIIDIKPYISEYDNPLLHQDHESNDDICVESKTEIIENKNINSDSGQNIVTGAKYESINPKASNEKANKPVKLNEETKLRSKCKKMEMSESEMHVSNVKTAEWITNPNTDKLKVCFTKRCMEHLSDDNTKQITCKLIQEILTEDPRSTYRRNKCNDRLYFMMVNGYHITVWFDYIDNCLAEVLRIIPIDMAKEKLGLEAKQYCI